MKKWLIGGAIAIVCILAVCTCIVVYTLSQIPSTVPSIGIIGGADGPTVCPVEGIAACSVDQRRTDFADSPAGFRCGRVQKLQEGLM